MPFDGSGTFNRVMNWVNDAAAGIKIKADRHDSEDDNFAAGLSNTLTKDGQSQPTANIPLNGKKLVNVGAPTAGTDAATKTYVDTADTAGLALKANIASPTFTGKVTLPAATAGGNGLNMPTGVAPTAPAHGDLWNTAVAWFTRITGVTYTLAMLEKAQIWLAQQIVTGGAAGNNAMNVATASLGEVEVRGNGVGATMMAFHRPGVFAAYIGIDTDNNWKVGGWSMGAAAYKLLHEGNYAAILDGRYIENSIDNLNLAAGFAQAVFDDEGTKSSGTYTPTAAGGNLKYVRNGGAFTLAADGDASKAYTMVVLLTNAAGAGAVTFSGFSVTGDVLSTVVGANFMLSIIHIGGIRSLNVQAI